MPKLVAGSRNRITCPKCQMTPELLEDIQEGLDHQMTAKLEIMQAIAQSGVGVQSLRSRQAEAEKLLKHLSRYRDVLTRPDVKAIEAKVADVQRILGVEVARAQGKQAAESGHEDLLDSMLGM